jgi:hypothetical protein
MTIWTEQRQIFRMVVFPISVDMLDLDWHAPGFGVAFVPSATGAAFPNLRNQISANEAIAIVRAVITGFEF